MRTEQYRLLPLLCRLGKDKALHLNQHLLRNIEWALLQRPEWCVRQTASHKPEDAPSQDNTGCIYHLDPTWCSVALKLLGSLSQQVITLPWCLCSVKRQYLCRPSRTVEGKVSFPDWPCRVSTQPVAAWGFCVSRAFCKFVDDECIGCTQRESQGRV